MESTFNIKREIHGFKLLKGGESGIEVSSVEYLKIGNIQIIDNVKRNRRLMPSDSLFQTIQKLKYYFFNLTGHWIPPYTEYFDKETRTLKQITADSTPAHLSVKNLWDKTIVTGAEWKPQFSGFVLKGRIETVSDRYMGLATPYVTEDDDIGFYDDCLFVLQEIAKELNGFLNTAKFSLDEAVRNMPQSMLLGKSPEEQAEFTMEYLQSRGAIIMMDGNQENKELTNEITMHITSNSIDSHLQEEAEYHESDIDGDPDEEGEEEGESDDGPTGEEGVSHPDGDEWNENVGGMDGGSVAGVPEDQESRFIPDPVKKTNPFGPPAADIPADISGDVPKPKKEDSVNMPGDDLEAMEHSENLGVEVEEDDEW